MKLLPQMFEIAIYKDAASGRIESMIRMRDEWQPFVRYVVPCFVGMGIDYDGALNVNGRVLDLDTIRERAELMGRLTGLPVRDETQ